MKQFKMAGVIKIVWQFQCQNRNGSKQIKMIEIDPNELACHQNGWCTIETEMHHQLTP
jgi:hypothetical protein